MLHKGIPWLVAVAFVAASCSSTSQDTGLPEASAPGEPGAVETGAAADPLTPGTASGPGTPPIATLGPPSSAPGDGTTSGGGTRRSTRVGVGISATQIRIGMWNMVGSGTCTILGIDAESDEQCGESDEREWEAIAGYINQNGGAAGREVVPISFNTTLENSPFAVQAEAACEHFTSDAKVFAVISEGVIGRDHLARCLADRGVPVVDPSSFPFDDRTYAELAPFLYQPQRARPNRWVRAYIDGLHDQDYFGNEPTIGLFRFNTGPYTRVTENVLKPRLARYGLEVAEEAIIRQPPSVAGWSDMQGEISSAILRFKQAGVNRVIFFENIGEIGNFYFPQAEGQAFRPRYGFSSTQWSAFYAQIAPPEQLRNSLGVGWMPFFDVDSQQDPGRSPAAERCKKIMQGAGLEGGAGRNSKCDSLLFLDAALDQAAGLGLPLTVNGLRRAVEALGTSYEPNATFTTRFTKGRYDGPASLRYFFFDSDCGCFQYRGGKLRSFR